MDDLYLRVFRLLPGFLRHRIHPLEASIERFVASAAARNGRLRILDAGAGETRFARHFNGHFYFSLDSGVGDSNWDYSRIDVCGDLHSLPLCSKSVDAVVNTQVLEHVEDPARVLAEFHRVLKPEGELYLTAPQGWHEHQQPHDFFRFTRFSLEKLLRQAGFRQFAIDPMGGYFHYLGHRLTFVPKIVFGERRGWSRALLFPLEVLSLGVFCFFSPLLCFYLDRLDRKQEFTLGYRCLARK